MYKQAVESTDVYLGMGGKDESSTSCEDMVIKIKLPEVNGISGRAVQWSLCRGEPVAAGLRPFRRKQRLGRAT